MKKDEIRMRVKEAERLKVVGAVVEGKLSQVEAGKRLGVSYRQIKRIVSRIKKEGSKGIIHRGRGRESNRQIEGRKKDEIVGLYREKYPDFGPTFFVEKLEENHGIKISRESVRKMLIKEGLHRSKKKHNKGLHVWRERREHRGELTQIDGSHHRWLENRLDQEFCLMGYIDDATNEIFGVFYEYEGVFPILDSFQTYIQENGLPESVYLDRHSTYKVNRKTSIDEDLEGEGPSSQFEQVMKTLGVKVIHARSPQAKGRVERLFETLQDRLVKEMRLANICSITEANKFLKDYLEIHNAKFKVVAKSDDSWFRPVSKEFDYKWTFVVRATRAISKDFTIRFCNRVFLVKNPTRRIQGQKVLIKQALDGSLRFETKDRILTVMEVSQEAIDRVKLAQKELKQQLQKPQPISKKSKKSFMDRQYFGKGPFPGSPSPQKLSPQESCLITA